MKRLTLERVNTAETSTELLEIMRELSRAIAVRAIDYETGVTIHRAIGRRVRATSRKRDGVPGYHTEAVRLS